MKRLPRRDRFGTITMPVMRLAMTYESSAISPGLRHCEEPFKNVHRIVNPNGDAAISCIETRNKTERLP
ncbi:MAG TPA: hypothetical protein VLS85_15135, partial [Hanamia sp.]|nr:hypothetical protein [Hanamia sp.]